MSCIFPFLPNADNKYPSLLWHAQWHWEGICRVIQAFRHGRYLRSAGQPDQQVHCIRFMLHVHVLVLSFCISGPCSEFAWHRPSRGSSRRAASLGQPCVTWWGRPCMVAECRTVMTAECLSATWRSSWVTSCLTPSSPSASSRMTRSHTGKPKQNGSA